MHHDESNATLWDTLEAPGDARATHARTASHVAAAACTPLHPSIAAAVRTAYFCEAGELAVRYGVSADDVIEHLERAGLGRAPRAEHRSAGEN